jgi:hypothetical protein
MEAFESFVAVALEAEGLVVSPAVKFPVTPSSPNEPECRIRDVASAIECLCEEAPGVSGSLDRWDRLAQRFDVWARLAESRSYTAEQIGEDDPFSCDCDRQHAE